MKAQSHAKIAVYQKDVCDHCVPVHLAPRLRFMGGAQVQPPTLTSPKPFGPLKGWGGWAVGVRGGGGVACLSNHLWNSVVIDS